MSEYTYSRTRWDALQNVLDLLERDDCAPGLHISFEHEGRRLVTIRPDGSGTIQHRKAGRWGEPVETFASVEELVGLLRVILGGAASP